MKDPGGSAKHVSMRFVCGANDWRQPVLWFLWKRRGGPGNLSGVQRGSGPGGGFLPKLRTKDSRIGQAGPVAILRSA